MQILAVIVGFILTGIIGNQLLQRWQHRTWLHQQRFLGAEKEFAALRDLTAEITSLANRRLYRMRRLLWSVSASDLAKMEHWLQEYDATLIAWNDNLNSFYVRLNFYLSYYDTTKLERELHEPLQRVGSKIESLVRQRRQQLTPSRGSILSAERELLSLQVATVNFTRDLSRDVEAKKERVYFGRQVHFTRQNMREFSTWDLIKGLFVRDIDGFTVRRTSSDL